MILDKQLLAVKHATEKISTFESRKLVHVKGEDIVATDGRILARIKHEDHNETTTITQDDIRHAEIDLRSKPCVEIEGKDRNYPDYERLIDNTEISHECTLSFKLLEKAYKTIKQFKGKNKDTACKIEFRINEKSTCVIDPIKITAIDASNERELNIIIMPML